jgi:hypothetical protein
MNNNANESFFILKNVTLSDIMKSIISSMITHIESLISSFYFLNIFKIYFNNSPDKHPPLLSLLAQATPIVLRTTTPFISQRRRQQLRRFIFDEIHKNEPLCCNKKPRI